MRHIEPLSNGLVTARDPSLLKEGELQRADNLIYPPASPSLAQAQAGTLASGTAGGTINGLRHCAFDNDLSLLVVQANNAYLSTSAVTPGAFTSLGAQTNGSPIHTVHYNGRHYLFNGVGPNQVLRRDGTLRRHGMEAISATPQLSPGSAGVWPLTDDTLPAYYEYWTTEVYKNDALGEEIESTFVGEPGTFQVTTSTSTVIVSRPAQENGIATHWRVYRSAAKYVAADKSFPIGFLIADVPITQLTFTDGGGSTAGPTFPGTVTDAVRVSGGKPFWFAGAWTLPDNIKADDGAVATSASVIANTSDLNGSAMELKAFGFTNIGTPITDIKVEVEGKTIGSALLQAYLSWSGDADQGGPGALSAAKTFALTSSTSVKSVSGLWDRTWNGLEFADSVFRVYLVAVGTSASVTGQIELDYCKVTISHGGTTGAQIISFPKTDITVGGVTFSDGSHGEPPVASFGDIFEDSLVTNDPDNKGVLRYSLETLPEAFAPEYFLPLTTSEHDEITFIKALGNSALLVGLNTYVARVDFLPRAEDSEFSRGRAWDVVQGSHGVVGSRAGVTFFIPQQGLFLAHISRHGPMMTNGYQADTLTDDLDFLSMVSPARLNQCEFINHPEQYRLILYYTPAGGSSNTKALVFHYHPYHLKDGKPKVTGPLDIVHNGAVVALLPSGEEVHYVANNAFVYRQGAGEPLPYVLQSREIYPGGPGASGSITKLLLHQNGGGVIRVTPTIVAANVEPRTDQQIEVIAPSHGFVRVPMRIACDGASFLVEGADDPIDSLDFMSLEYTGFGNENYPA